MPPNDETPAAPPQTPPPVAAPPPPATAPPNEQWQPWAWARVQQEARKAEEAQARAAAAEASAAASAARIADLERRAARAEAGVVMVGSGLDALKHAEVQDFILERYARAREQAGDKAPAFADWLTAQKAAPSPLLAPYLTAPAAQEAPPAPPPPGAPPGAPPPRPPGPNPNNGTAPPPGASTRYTDAYVAQLTSAGQWSPAHTKALQAELEAEGLVISARK